ncbi:MAG: hypothetical protein AB1705_20350 [Verrucomicrobiota bacterium]
MQTIRKDELFRNLGGFLKAKGIELKDGSYTARIRRCCDLLTEAINGTQKTVRKTKVKVDKTLDKLRQTIHENTAPPAEAQAETRVRKARRAKHKRGES